MKRLTLLFAIFPLICSCSHEYNSDTLDLSFYQWNLWLDKDAEWKNDSLYLPPVDISALPLNKPTIGWDALHRGGEGKLIRIPATVEEHYWGENGHSYGVSGDYTGVSWFTTQFSLPEEWKGKRIVLKFESVRQRAEIYLNEELVGYDMINGTPFEVDVTGKINYYLDNKLAIRITDPNGNFDWRDYSLYKWGEIGISPSHGFGGITGSVVVQNTDSIYIDDLFIKNRPDLTAVDIELSLSNLFGFHVPGEVSYTLRDLSSGRDILKQADPHELFLEEETIFTTISLPDAKLWSPETPNLYALTVEWKGKDGSHSKVREEFGFRWFEVKKVEGDKQFYLNEKRIVLRSAISWGHWPLNGIFPTPELAEKQVANAKTLGLNMLNFHRGIGQTIVLDEADRQGLLYYEEPGGYAPQESEFSKGFKREKLLRMIKRDRNHPSLVIYSMINEAGRDPFPNEVTDIQDAHLLDATRMITFTSTHFPGPWFYGGQNPRGPAPFKMHMLPNDDSLYTFGYWDEHHALGTGVYMDVQYNGPNDIYRHYDIQKEIVFLGEEGAIGTPPRLELINEEIASSGKTGWDSDQYIGQFKAFDNFLDEKGFREAFPTVDALTTSLGAVAYYYHGRTIENFRIGNSGDGFVVNGWEETKIENHSGIVDAYRNFKADPSILAYYNRPLYVAVKIRDKVIALGDTLISDHFIVNEENLNGKYFLRVTTMDEFSTLDEAGFNLNVTGGHTYGELLRENVPFVPVNPGYYTILAQLYDGDRLVAEGKEQAFVISYDVSDFNVPIAVLDTSGEMQDILQRAGIKNTHSYDAFDNMKEKVLVAGGTVHPSISNIWAPDNEALLEWIKQGNTLVITKNADTWAAFLDEREVVDYRGSKELGRDWFGGNYFVREHALFEDLPVNTAFNWEYQSLAQYDNRKRFGMRLAGEECVVGCYADHNREVYTAVGIIKLGEGQVIISSLDIAAAIKEGGKAAITAKRILLNFLEYGLDVDDYFTNE